MGMWVWALTRPGMRTMPVASMILRAKGPAGRSVPTERMVAPWTTTKASSRSVSASSMHRARQ